MKKISFKKLHELVAEIDYICPESYPVRFEVDGRTFMAGIGNWMSKKNNEFTELIEEKIGLLTDLQYVLNYDVSEFVDLQDPDAMDFNEIETMLKKKCKITGKSIIMLDEDESFDGELLDIYKEGLSQELINSLKN